MCPLKVVVNLFCNSTMNKIFVVDVLRLLDNYMFI